MRVLIAGGTGFLGRAIVAALTDRNVDVSVLTRDAARAADTYPFLSASFVEGNLEDPDALVAAMVDMDAAIFTAQFSGYPVEAPAVGRTFLEVDTGGTQSLAYAANRAGVPKIIYLSGVGADVSSKRVWYQAKG